MKNKSPKLESSIVKLITKTRWIFGAARAHTLFTSDLLIKGYGTATDFMGNFKLRNLFYIYGHHFHKSYRDEKDMERFGQKLKSLFGSNFKKFARYYQKEVEKEIKIFNHLNTYKNKINYFNRQKITDCLKICREKFPLAVAALQYPIFISVLKDKNKLKFPSEMLLKLNKIRNRHARVGWIFVDFIIPFLLKKTSEFLKINQKITGCLTIDEIIDSLKKKKLLISKKELNQRYRLAIIIKTPQNKKILINQQAKVALKSFNKKTESSSLILRGQCCYQGKLKGQICKINNHKEVHKIKKNQILATYMTTVHFVPYLKKIKAILTEEGGIGCHAVIVAREFHKPCIVGIKNLMDSLKDGDLVEVDANKGIVKILRG